MERTKLILHLAAQNFQKENSTSEESTLREDDISESQNDPVVLTELQPMSLNANSSSLSNGKSLHQN